MVNIKVKKQKGINKVKQKVSQKVNQKVIVNVGESITTPKRRRAPPRPKQQKQPQVQQALPRTTYQQPNVDSSNLVSLLMKNLYNQEARPAGGLVPEVKPPPKPNELEKPKREILAQKAEERTVEASQPILREAGPLQYRITQEEQSSSSRYPKITSFFLPASNLAQPKPVESFTAKFNTSKEDKAEQEALDRFENAKRLTALYRQVENPVVISSNVGINAEVRADPDVESLELNRAFIKPASLTGEKKAQYSSVLGYLFRNRSPLVAGESEPSEFETPRLTVGQRISLRAREPPAPLISFQDITAGLTAPEPKQKEGELEFGPSILVEAVEQGPTLTTQLKQPVGGASQLLGEEQSETLFSRQPAEAGAIIEEPAEPPTELPLSFAFEEPAPALPAERAEIQVAPPKETSDIEELNLGAEVKAEPAPQPRRAFTGSELLPPIEGASTILNQPFVESPLTQLLQPKQTATLLEESGIVESKAKKVSFKRQEIESLADRSNIKHKGKSNYDVALELSDKGIQVPEEWLIKSKAGKPPKK